MHSCILDGTEMVPVTPLRRTLVSSLQSKCCSCHQQGLVGSKTSLQQNPPVLNWRWQLTRVILYDSRKMIVVVIVVLWCYAKKLLTLCCFLINWWFCCAVWTLSEHSWVQDAEQGTGKTLLASRVWTSLILSVIVCNAILMCLLVLV